MVLASWAFNLVQQRKCEDVLKDTDAHFKQAKIINFDIICRQCRGEEVPKNILAGYQTVRDNDLLHYPEKDKKNYCQVTDRQDINFKNKTIKEHFESQKKSSIKKVFFKKILREKE